MEGKMSRQQFIQYIRCCWGDQREMVENAPEIVDLGVKYLYLGWLTFSARTCSSASG